MRAVLFGLFLLSTAGGQQPSENTQDIPLPQGTTILQLLSFSKITFDFEGIQMLPLRWGFEINSDGKGRYYERGAVSDSNPSGNRWQDVHVSAKTFDLLSSGAARRGEKCETKARNIANIGKKKLIYWMGDVPYTCEFKYSDDAGVMKTAEAFIAMAATMQMGERLQHDLQFDRLGLDAEMDSLSREFKDGRAIEVPNIAPVLKSIMDDERVMERVRRKAARILVDAGVTAAAP